MSRPKAFRLVFATLAAAALGLVAATGLGAANNSEQVVFSGIAFEGSTFQYQSPAGFWIWCESDSQNPYLGACQGAMYIYALGLTKHVAGHITEQSTTYTMEVASRDGSISCTLVGPNNPVPGPRNTVTVGCSMPAGSATSPNAVVNVTGP